MANSVLSTRERVLDEAARLIRRRGFRGMSLSELLAAADVRKGSLYFHFRSKRDLGLSVLERERTRFMAFLRATLQAGTPEARLYHFFDGALAAHRHMGFVGGCLWGNTALEMSDTDEGLTAFVARVFAEWTELIEAVIADGQAAGRFRADVTARTLARHVIAAIEGGIMQSRLKKAEGPLRCVLDSLKTLLKPLPEQPAR